jgi:hypothetical protein
MATEHQYYPLNVTRNEIRLVRLAPSRSFPTKAYCSLVHLSLDDNITFEALSYAWGDLDLKRSIFLDGRRFLVTRNLEIALRHLRYVSDERTIWIDALCIDQNDIDERNEQVARMQQIYQSATKVVVWLGPASKDSDIAIDFLLQASAKQQEFERWFPSVLTDPFIARSLRAVCNLGDRNYWKRIWIVQEIVSATSVVVRCGFRCLRWADVIYLPLCVASTNNITEEGYVYQEFLNVPEVILMLQNIIANFIIPVTIHECKRRLALRDITLEWLLISYRCLLSTDPRDKVFALVGMAHQYDAQFGLSLDYKLSKEETYIKALESVIKQAKASRSSYLNIILESNLYLSDRKLPSWVPDWSLALDARRRSSIDRRHFKASGSSPPETSLTIDGGVLIVSGLEVKSIGYLALDHVQSFAIPSSIHPSYALEVYGATQRALVASYKLAMCTSENYPHSRQSADILGKKLVRTLTANQTMPISTVKFGFLSEKDLQDCWQKLMSCLNTTEGDVKIDPSGANSDPTFYGYITRHLLTHKFCVSSDGTFLLAPFQARVGDVICVLFGCDMPVVLRRPKKRTEENRYVFVGECYMHGIMNGEAVEGSSAGKYNVTEFRIH